MLYDMLVEVLSADSVCFGDMQAALCSSLHATLTYCIHELVGHIVHVVVHHPNFHNRQQG